MKYKIDLSSKHTERWVKRKRRSGFNNKKYAQSVNIVDLFCGCGGISLGIIESCLKNEVRPNIKFAIDSNLDAVETYRENFSSFTEHLYQEDVESLFNDNKASLTFNSLNDIDILVAGPPCQGHSDLNNSSRRDDPRNNLYMFCAHGVKKLNPKLVLIENVPTVVHSKQDVVNKTKIELEKIGYISKELVVDFLNLGLPQTRKRHLLIASKDKSFIEKLSLNSLEEKPRLIDFISDLEDSEKKGSLMTRRSKLTSVNKSRIDYLFENDLFDLPNSQRPNCHKNKKHSYVSSYVRLNYHKPAQTITSGFGSMGQGRFVHPNRKRTLIPQEASRIQGFPDFFKFKSSSLTSLRKLIANAVPPQLSFVILNAFLHHNCKNNKE